MAHACSFTNDYLASSRISELGGSTVGLGVVVEIFVGNGCSFQVELGKDFGNEASVDHIPEEAVTLNIRNGVLLDIPEELFGHNSGKDLLMRLHFFLLFLLEGLDIF